MQAAALILLYLNADGGTFQPGVDDAAANTSSLLAETARIPAWAHHGRLEYVKSCVGELLARWDVEVTDVDPGDAPHYEVVIGGAATDLDVGGAPDGLSPFDSACRVIPGAIVFTFAEQLGTDSRRICEVTAREVAHAWGLDSEALCTDVTSHRSGCGVKAFRDLEAPCGDDGARACHCGGETQNSWAMLDERIGLAGVGNPAPAVTITAPADGAEVSAGFAIDAGAIDNVRVARVELWIDGVEVGSFEQEAVRVVAPDGLAPGAHTVEVRAYDHGGASGVAVASVVLVADPPVGELPGVDDPPVVDVAVDDVDEDPVAGGCDAGGGGAGGLGLLAVALVAGLRRRRRR